MKVTREISWPEKVQEDQSAAVCHRSVQLTSNLRLHGYHLIFTTHSCTVDTLYKIFFFFLLNLTLKNDINMSF